MGCPQMSYFVKIINIKMYKILFKSQTEQMGAGLYVNYITSTILYKYLVCKIIESSFKNCLFTLWVNKAVSDSFLDAFILKGKPYTQHVIFTWMNTAMRAFLFWGFFSLHYYFKNLVFYFDSLTFLSQSRFLRLVDHLFVEKPGHVTETGLTLGSLC